MKNILLSQSGFSPVNGLQMYYERYGSGSPLLLVHGGGSTIQSCFEQIIPMLAEDWEVIAVEMQAHGRTNDRPAATSFVQDADDLAVFLENLGIRKTSVFGFSNGATTALQLAIRHPEKVERMILGSALSKRNGVPGWFWDFMSQASLVNMPQLLQDSFLKVNPDPKALQVMHDRDAKRMVEFEDISDDFLKSISIPALIINGDQDVITVEHAVVLHRLLPNSRLAILPGGHGAYIGEITTLTPDFQPEDLIAIPMIRQFLKS